ncbi:hypothetical protein BN13_80041 [Nostocoides jenkinsii Ben 74]|uniref:Uncharacterized protein n=2 Tax=Nostocoides jenkinsii TaxID=330834 RepID=A0A077MGQ3_9MICO|nr:hypothetical protein BN13_80041 [Tetrasphaera jenkinsii Ben 74]
MSAAGRVRRRVTALIAAMNIKTPIERGRVGIVSPLGGVMTVEVGAITGHLNVWTLDGVHVLIGYVGSPDIYTAAGAIPDGCGLVDAVALLAADPGVDGDGNPVPARLPNPESAPARSKGEGTHERENKS